MPAWVVATVAGAQAKSIPPRDAVTFFDWSIDPAPDPAYPLANDEKSCSTSPRGPLSVTNTMRPGLPVVPYRPAWN